MHHHRHRLGFVFTAVLLATGVAAFVGLRATVHDLDRSLDHFYAQTHFADMTVVGGQADDFATAAKQVDGVAAVNVRNTTTLSVFLHDGTTKVQGTIIGIPASGPALNAPVITAGRAFPPASTESVAIVEQHTAEDLHVRPGETLQALGIGSVGTLQVTGVGLSPEYLLPAQSQQQIVAAAGSFAVIFVPDAVAEQLGGAAAIPETLVRYRADADRGAVDRRLTRLAIAHDASLVEPRSHQPSNALIDEVQTAFKEASLVIPALALIVAIFVGALACARDPDHDRRKRRSQIATISGAGAGAVIGLLAARIGGPLLTDAMNVPTHVASSNIVALVVGVGAALIAGPVAYGIGTVLVHALDDAALGPGPAFVTAIAAAAAVICVVAPVGVVDSAQATLVAASRLEKVDAQVAFAAAVQAPQLAFLRSVPGVAAAEPVPSANVVVGHGRRHYVTSLEAFRANTTMQTFETPGGRPLQLPATGALISQALGRQLHAQPGDNLEITLPGAGVAPLDVRVAAFTSDTLGKLVFLRISGLRAALGADANSFAGGLFNTATIRFADDADTAAIARRIQAEPSVVVYVPVAAALNSVSEARPILRAVTDALLVIGVIVIVLGLSAAVVLHVRTRGRHGIVRLVVEVLAALAAGILVGSLLGTFAADRLVHALSSDLISLTRDIDRSTYLFAGGMVVVVGVVMLVFGILTLPKPTATDGRGDPGAPSEPPPSLESVESATPIPGSG